MTNKEIKIQDIGEFGFIRSIMDNCHFSSEKLVKGIGDDCAVIGPYGNKLFLITTDLLVEDVHFIWGKISPEHLGQKAVAVNLSDIAAMGGKALHLFVSICIPKSMRVKDLHSIYRGIKTVCECYRVNILGGDTSASPDRLIINVSVLGEVNENEIIYRDGARPGDAIYVTGTLGDSAAGLELIKKELSAPEALTNSLIKTHNLPVPCLEIGRMIARTRKASAMIDLSDGLLADLRHICEASDTGAKLYLSALPISQELETLSEINNFDPYDFALSGGEDYRLLVTVPRKHASSFQKTFETEGTSHIYLIGEITKRNRITILMPDGLEKQIDAKGFNHFFHL
jgi:thiamine-monophosphate kinase